MHAARRIGRRWTHDQPITKPLMVAFTMIVCDELRDHLAEVPLAEWNDAIKAFFLDRPDESLGIGVRVWRALGDQPIRFRKPHGVM